MVGETLLTVDFSTFWRWICSPREACQQKFLSFQSIFLKISAVLQCSLGFEAIRRLDSMPSPFSATLQKDLVGICVETGGVKRWTDQQMFLLRLLRWYYVVLMICYLLSFAIYCTLEYPITIRAQEKHSSCYLFTSFSRFKKKALCWNQGCWLLRRAGCRAGFLLAEIFPFSKSLRSWSSGKVKKSPNRTGPTCEKNSKIGWSPICG